MSYENISTIPLTPETSGYHLDGLHKFAFGRKDLVLRISEITGIPIVPVKDPQKIDYSVTHIDAWPLVDKPDQIAYYAVARLDNPAQSDESVMTLISLARARIQAEKEIQNSLPPSIQAFEALLTDDYGNKLREANFTRVIQPQRKKFIKSSTSALVRLLPSEQRAKITLLAENKGLVQSEAVNEAVETAVGILLDTNQQTDAKNELLKKSLKPSEQPSPMPLTQQAKEIDDWYLGYIYELLPIILQYPETRTELKRRLSSERLIPDMVSDKESVVKKVFEHISFHHSQIVNALRETGTGGAFINQLESVYRSTNSPYIKLQILSFIRDEGLSADIPVALSFTSDIFSELTEIPDSSTPTLGSLDAVMPSAVSTLLMRHVMLSELESDAVLARIRDIFIDEAPSDEIKDRLQRLKRDLQKYVDKPEDFEQRAADRRQMQIFLQGLKEILQ